MAVHGRWEHRSNIRSNIVPVAGRLLYKLYAAQSGNAELIRLHFEPVFEFVDVR